jgi:wyosine [tRNA(Phe)-imidazoG37] synthetase (radical SAM superfamily)
MPDSTLRFTSVYGPIESWRFHRSLGIDPIGPTSSCSFQCVYCQLGEIEEPSLTRQTFVPTQQIQQELSACRFWDQVDIITLSGSGEPTLALNLGEILTMIQATTQTQVAVLTNGSLLHDVSVRSELAIADYVVVKVDAIDADSLQRINQPLAGITPERQWLGLQKFREMYRRKLSIQTMLLLPWSEALQDQYIQQMQILQPDEIQLNTPTRPKPLAHQLESRGNCSGKQLDYPVHQLKTVCIEVLVQFSKRIQIMTGIPVRYPPHQLRSEI